jgi:LysM repeat protein
MFAASFRRLGASLLVATVLAAAGCASQRPALVAPLPPSPTAPPGVRTHVVARGDTLWSLGRRYGMPYQEIMRANGLTSAQQLVAGRRLIIPQAPALPRIEVPLVPNPQWTHIVIHHTATPTGNASIFNRAHRRRGFSNGLGYHFLIDNGTSGRRDGQIEVGPRWLRQEKGAHCNAGGMNQHGIGISLVGDFTHRPPSPSQLEALAALISRLQAYYRIPSHRVIRHRDVVGKTTACPGAAFPWSRLKQRLAASPPAR